MPTRALPRKRPVLLLVTLFLVLGFLGTTLVSYQVSRKAIRESILTQELPLTSDNVYSEILKDLVRPLFVGSMMASNTFLRDWVLEGERDKSQLMRYLSEVMVRYGAFTSFFVSEKSHKYYHPSGVIKQVNELESRDAWYYRVRAMRDPYEINVDPDLVNRDLLTIFINYRVNDFDGNFIGATGVGLTVDAVRSAISHHQERFGRRISFVDLQGRILLTADDPEQKENNIHFIEGLRELAPTILSQKSGSYEYELDGKTRLLNVRYVQELKWFLFVEKMEDSALVGIRRTLYVNLAVCFAITILVVCITGLALSRYQGRMEEMATRDKLTGLLNRQTLDVLFQQAISLALRANEPLVVILADLDHFKAVNDKYGHMVGDQVLKLTAASLQQQLRSSDTVCRWGGEEFLMILRNCDADAGAALSEKLRAALVDDPELSALVPGGVSASFGLTQLIPGECVETLVGRADTALYAAKQAGRNCVKTA